MGLGHGNTPTWLNQTDSGRTWTSANRVVQSGLVLNLDAGASTSYPGSGTTWTDLSAVTISSATGALPIYNTTDTYGLVKGSGTRTDAFASSLVLAIPMDGANNGTTFTDESANIRGSGSAKAITRFGNTKTLTAQSKFYGSSGFFDGTGDYLRVPASSDFTYGTGDFTFEAWIYPTISADQLIYAQTSSGNNFINISLAPTTNYLSAQINSSGAGNNVVTTIPVTLNAWNHIAVTRQSAVVNLFINGILGGSGTRNIDLSLASIQPTIGTYSHTSALNFNGYIQDFRIYKGLAKYTANFTPPVFNNGTLTNGPTYSSANGGAIVLDGTNDKVVVPYTSSLNPSNLTLSSWFKRTSAGFYSHPANLPIANGTWVPPYITYGLEFTASTDEISFTLSFTDNNLSYTTAPASAALAVGSWVNVVGTYDGSFRKIYVNGQLITSVAETRTILTTNTDFILGAENRDQNSYMLNGSIAQTLIYNRALSAAEILQNFSAIRGRFGI